MRITLITPLYPPDIADPAPYVKELAARLSHEHAVTVLTYGNIPEDVPGVRFTVVPKNIPLPLRVLRFTYALFVLCKETDHIIAQNGASTELPLALVSLIRKTPSLLRLGDDAALRFAETRPLLALIQTLAMWRAARLMVHSPTLMKKRGASITHKTTCCPRPIPRPEVLPFEDQIEVGLRMKEYEASWSEHVAVLRTLIHI